MRDRKKFHSLYFLAYVLILCSILLQLCEASDGEATKNKPVITQLNAKWPHTPLLLEAAEYMSEESPATFWTFVDHVADLDEQVFIKSKLLDIYIYRLTEFYVMHLS